ncbi:Fur family transcriptional regulator [Pseudorhodoferax sp.]|uniref:Fur family transcriptional regulator n=1 Tax=Pseudorhodoferax sp. TaxID=1993553 RepID=UPI0039E34E91
MERATRQRHAIRAVMETAARPLLPTEILVAAQCAVPALGLATVYRNLKQLVEAGEIQPVELPGEPPRYELVSHRHHHHFHCTACNRVFDVHACPGDMRKMAPRGFTVESHELTLYGACSDCRHTAAGPGAGRQPTLPPRA